MFSSNGTFKHAPMTLSNQANKALFLLIKRVQQGGILPPVLFALYIDVELSQSKVGYHWYGTFTGVLANAKDITLLASCPSVLFQICEKLGASQGVIQSR